MTSCFSWESVFRLNVWLSYYSVGTCHHAAYSRLVCVFREAGNHPSFFVFIPPGDTWIWAAPYGGDPLGNSDTYSGKCGEKLDWHRLRFTERLSLAGWGEFRKTSFRAQSSQRQIFIYHLTSYSRFHDLTGQCLTWDEKGRLVVRNPQRRTSLKLWELVCVQLPVKWIIKLMDT